MRAICAIRCSPYPASPAISSSDLIGNTLEVVKLTSLGSVVALPELLYAARSTQSITYNPSPIVLAAAMYFLLLWPGVRVLSRLEHRMLVSR